MIHFNLFRKGFCGVPQGALGVLHGNTLIGLSGSETDSLCIICHLLVVGQQPLHVRHLILSWLQGFFFSDLAWNDKKTLFYFSKIMYPIDETWNIIRLIYGIFIGFWVLWRDSREVRCVVHTPMIESSIPCLREAVCVKISSYLP